MTTEKIEKAKNVVELRDRLLTVLNKVSNNEIGLQEANTEARIAGAVISAARTEMEYNKEFHVAKEIPFLESK